MASGEKNPSSVPVVRQRGVRILPIPKVQSHLRPDTAPLRRGHFCEQTLPGQGGIVPQMGKKPQRVG